MPPTQSTSPPSNPDSAEKDIEQKIDALLDLACLGSDHDRPARRALAEKLLDEKPELATQNIFTMALCGAHQAMAPLLVENASVANEAGGPRNWPPLRYLCFGRLRPREGHDAVETARLLLEAGADPNQAIIFNDKYHYTLLTGVVGEGERGVESEPPHARAHELVQLLLDRGANPNDGQALYNTQFTEDDSLIELLLAGGLKQGDAVNWSTDGMTTLDYQLCQAVSWGFANRVRLLLSHGADPNAKSLYSQRPAYALARRKGREDIAQMLVDAGASTALDEEDELWVRLHQPNLEPAREWLRSHPELLKSADSFVQLAEDGNEAALRLMLDEGAEVDVENRNHRTALHVSCMKDHLSVVRLLLSRGASLEKRDGSYGGTAVGWAQAHGKHELRDELLDQTTDFFDLVRYGRREQVLRLLERRPELALSTSGAGNTALHMVAGHTAEPAPMIDLLLEAGADINARNNEGKTPLGVQDEPEDALIVELLRARGAH